MIGGIEMAGGQSSRSRPAKRSFVGAREGLGRGAARRPAGDPLDPMRHSAAHVMAEAVMDLFPGTKLGIGPAIKDGFYYDFQLDRARSPDDLDAIEARMAESVAADHPFVGRSCRPRRGGRSSPSATSRSRSRSSTISPRRRRPTAPMPPTTVYEHGPVHRPVPRAARRSTGKIGPFKLLAVAGAYWRGDQKRPMLQRIYGTVWSTQEELDSSCGGARRRRSATTAGSASSSTCSGSTTSPGLRVLASQGLDACTGRCATRCASSRPPRLPGDLHAAARPPEALAQSGHWDLYRDNMFLVETTTSRLQPQADELPGVDVHLPLERALVPRVAAAAVGVRRAAPERAVRVFSGLTRVRHFFTDDAHIYVRPDQIEDEIVALMGEVREAYSWFGLEPTLTFGTRPDKALGEPGDVARDRGLILEALEASGVNYRVKPKDGAFYAPKIDIQVEDALGREWQTATIQVDRVMLPERFDLHYIDEHGQRQRPVAIHRAIYGSLERFIGVLIEHFAGAFPLWCAPVQAVVIPIADRHIEAAEELAPVLRGAGLRVEVDDSSNRMQNKIRLAQEQKVPYMVVLGDREIEARTASPRTRAGEQQPPEAWEAFADRWRQNRRSEARSDRQVSRAAHALWMDTGDRSRRVSGPSNQGNASVRMTEQGVEALEVEDFADRTRADRGMTVGDLDRTAAVWERRSMIRLRWNGEPSTAAR